MYDASRTNRQRLDLIILAKMPGKGAYFVYLFTKGIPSIFAQTMQSFIKG